MIKYILKLINAKFNQLYISQIKILYIKFNIFI